MRKSFKKVLKKFKKKFWFRKKKSAPIPIPIPGFGRKLEQGQGHKI